MLCKLCYYVNEDTNKSVCYAILHSHLSYVCTAWGQNLNPKHRINLLQKKVMRIISFARYDAHTLPIKLPKLSINNQEIKRASYTKFLGVLLDENLSWKEHLKYTENKIAKSSGLMYKAKSFLDKDSLLSLYFSYIHSYINYANLAWASTHKTNLEKIHSQQKHALRIVYNKDRYYHTKESSDLVTY